MDPVGALIGSILLGIGTLLIFGSVKNKKVFGPDGILSSALTTGKLVDTTLVPQAYETHVVKPEGTGAVWVLPRGVRDSVAAIANDDPQLGDQISAQLNSIDSDSTKDQVMPLAQLLQLAESKGHLIDANVIRLYVKELTGESV